MKCTGRQFEIGIDMASKIYEPIQAKRCIQAIEPYRHSLPKTNPAGEHGELDRTGRGRCRLQPVNRYSLHGIERYQAACG